MEIYRSSSTLIEQDILHIIPTWQRWFGVERRNRGAALLVAAEMAEDITTEMQGIRQAGARSHKVKFCTAVT